MYITCDVTSRANVIHSIRTYSAISIVYCKTTKLENASKIRYNYMSLYYKHGKKTFLS